MLFISQSVSIWQNYILPVLLYCITLLRWIIKEFWLLTRLEHGLCQCELIHFHQPIICHLLAGVRDYIHVVDLAQGHVAAVKKLDEKCGLKVCVELTLRFYIDIYYLDAVSYDHPGDQKCQGLDKTEGHYGQLFCCFFFYWDAVAMGKKQSLIDWWIDRLIDITLL
jgi:hypothetical protein